MKLKSETHLTDLNLTSCSLNAESVNILSEGLAQSSMLKRLSLSRNAIDNSRGCIVVSALAKIQNPSLTELDLSWNKMNQCIEDTGGRRVEGRAC